MPKKQRTSSTRTMGPYVVTSVAKLTQTTPFADRPAAGQKSPPPHRLHHRRWRPARQRPMVYYYDVLS
jgi:hypothetical protein